LIATEHTPARERAARILLKCATGEHRAHDLLEEMQAEVPLGPSDAALSAELVLGGLRHRLTCEHIAARFYRGRWEGLRSPIRIILGLAVYQLCWLERVPDYAVVDQAVRMAKRYGRGAGTLVNAVLRSVCKARGPIIDRPASAAPQRYLPIDDERGRLFEDDVFPDPGRRPLDYLIAATSHPSWLVERWHRRFKPALCRQICDAGQRRPPLVLRTNPLRTTVGELLDRLRAAGCNAFRLEKTEAVALPGGPSPSIVAELIESGLCQPQDSTSMIPLRLAPPRPGEIVLDLCAGLGTKSTQAAEMMGNRGVVIAADIHEARLAKIHQSAARLGLTIVRPVSCSTLGEALRTLDRPPDLILLDVPCSNTGVLARRPEARYRASARALLSLCQLQRDLLQQALGLAGPRTRLIYSTCSLEREENEAQVEKFCEEHSSWRLVQQSLILPGRHHDGGFAAVLVRQGE